jgi:hypothetical protein
MLKHAKPYAEAGWLKALLVYSRGDGGWAMEKTGTVLTKQGEALDSFADAQAGWAIQSTSLPSGAKEGGLTGGVSCLWATACESVGSYVNSSSVQVTLAESWNGVESAIQTTANPTGAKASHLSGVSCTSLSACTAVGSYTNSAGTEVTLAEGWNGTAWSIQTTPNPTGAKASHLSGVSCASSSACEAIGSDTNSSGVSVTLAERWNGTEWAIQTTSNPTGATGSNLYGVSCTASTACTAVGTWRAPFENPIHHNMVTNQYSLAEVWNGTTWTIKETPNTQDSEGDTEDVLMGVSCTSTTACTAVGEYSRGEAGEEALVERWNGTAWATQTSVFYGNGASLKAVSCASSTVCDAVGYQLTPAEAHRTLSESWNGTTWATGTTVDPTGTTRDELSGISCPSTKACVVGGLSELSKIIGPLSESSWGF